MIGRPAHAITAFAGASLVACAPPVQAPSAWRPSPEPASEAPPLPALPVTALPDVELRDPHVAVVHGQAVPFDGIEEGLTWPALKKVLGPRQAGDAVTLQVARTVPMADVLRAAWAVHSADVHVQTLDGSGAMRAVAFGARRDGAAAAVGCHLAVFLESNGALRVAAPGGRREIAGDHPAATLARSLADERGRCPLKYVAFGAESDAAPWGAVFDVIVAIDQEKSAGDGRYVLGQAIHVTAR